jgi:hypothetical protein
MRLSELRPSLLAQRSKTPFVFGIRSRLWSYR